MITTLTRKSHRIVRNNDIFVIDIITYIRYILNTGLQWHGTALCRRSHRKAPTVVSLSPPAGTDYVIKTKGRRGASSSSLYYAYAEKQSETLQSASAYLMGNRLHHIQIVRHKLLVEVDMLADVHSALLYKSTQYNV
jgi:hypothetical protein